MESAVSRVKEAPGRARVAAGRMKSAAVKSSMKESASAAPSSAALLNSTPSHSSVSRLDSASAPGIDGTMSDVMVIPLKNPGLGTRTPTSAG